MAFQPIVDLNGDSVFAYESLVRGPNGESASEVLRRVNEENRYAFDQACRVKAIELASGLGMNSLLSINFLPNAVYNPEACIQTTLRAAKDFNFPQRNIIFEVTEGEKVTDHGHLKSIFDEYKRLGFKTAIDDFGAGYSGLNLLAEFQPDIIKLDRALIMGIDQDHVRQTIVGAVLSVTRELGIDVIAEGIETTEESQTLRDLGVRLFQGYLLAHPQTGTLPEYVSQERNP
ncbi:MAG: EAL domain-containing protein [Candidatus Omnitrophica bacterium]|nr:EAL domain-containing protein [Candidatus Omnitrophota bacterium]MCA9435387.1 EAL domain-containing protein [Candidatus Omnitrophota bacterium]